MPNGFIFLYMKYCRVHSWTHVNISLYEVDPLFLFYLNRARSNFQKCNDIIAMWKKKLWKLYYSVHHRSQQCGRIYFVTILPHNFTQNCLSSSSHKLHINQKLSQIHSKSSLQLNLHLIPKATVTKLSELIELVIDLPDF